MEVFDTELYAIEVAVGIALKNGQVGHRTSSTQAKPRWTMIHTRVDSETVIKRMQHTTPGPSQWLARSIIERTRQQGERGMTLEIHWESDHMDVEGNEKDDEPVKEAAERAGMTSCPKRFTSLTNIGCTISERE